MQNNLTYVDKRYSSSTIAWGVQIVLGCQLYIPLTKSNITHELDIFLLTRDSELEEKAIIGYMVLNLARDGKTTPLQA